MWAELPLATASTAPFLKNVHPAFLKSAVRPGGTSHHQEASSRCSSMPVATPCRLHSGATNMWWIRSTLAPSIFSKVSSVMLISDII